MDSTQNRRNRNTEKPVPGCLGRVVNFFDLGTVVAGNRLLTDKSHFDGFGHSRRQSDTMRINPVGNALDDKVVPLELTKGSSNRNYNGTSVKMLIAEEMSKEVELKHNSPNLVAKLMGLENLPQEKPVSVVKRRHSRSYSGSNTGTGLDSWQHEHQSLKQNGYKEFPDMTWKSRKGHYMSDETPEKVGRVEASNEKMALVRQKFVEAKSLSTNEKLRQSKQFQDALEVLSSNRGLFLKLLQEPISYSQNRQDFQSSSPPPKTNITVLRPSKLLSDNPILKSGRMNVKSIKKALNAGPVNRLNKINPAIPTPGCRLNENHTQPNRIVVLKPSGRPHNNNAAVSPSPSFLREQSVQMHGEPPDNGRIDSREIAKGITHKIHEAFSGNQREETLASTVFSDGYSGDESSFRKSESDYSSGNLSDSEIVTSTSGHTWGYMHKFEIPCGSSLSHFTGSPDSSVCREAKKRLSERWQLMASNGNRQEQRHLWKSSSTLGEMLALSDTKQVVTSEKEGIIGEQETRESPLCSTSNLNIDQFVNDSQINLLRSKSTPVNAGSSKVFVDSLNRVLDPMVRKADIPKEIRKMSTPKNSIKEKFSSLFSSRNKRPNTNKSSSFRSKHESEKPTTMLVQVPEKISDEPCKVYTAMEEDSLQNLQGSNSFSENPICLERKAGVISPEAKFFGTKPLASGILGENQDQPSPVSVLEPPFEEDESITTDSSNVKGDKSPPIESISRTLSWEDPSVDTATSYPLKQSRMAQGSEEEEEQELLLFIKSLLSEAGFDGDTVPNSLLARWYSPESPLDPALRDSYIDVNAKDVVHPAKRSQSRSIGKLVFDCVNTALVEILSHDLAKCRNRVHGNPLPCAPSLLVDEVWVCVKEWFPYEIPKDFLGDDEDSCSLLVEAAARKEVVGNVWNEHMRLEIKNLGKDIEGILLHELMQELAVEFASRV